MKGGLALQHANGMDAAQADWREAFEIFTELGAPEADEVLTRLKGTRQLSSPPAKPTIEHLGARVGHLQTLVTLFNLGDDKWRPTSA